MLCGFLVHTTLAAVRTPKSWTLINWQRLKAGMTEQQVIRQLGEPIDRKESRSLKLWCYEQAMTTEHPKPKTGFLRFKLEKNRRGSPVLKLYDWTEPNWSVIQAQIKALAEAGAEAKEQAQLEKEKALAERQAQRKQKQKEREAGNKIRTEEAKILKAEREKRFAEIRAEKEQYQKDRLKPFQDEGSRFFLFAGVAGIGAAIVACFVLRNHDKR